MEAASPFLAVRDLQKQYGRTTALDALSLDIESGERVAVLGPNGAGKTTFIGLALGLLKPTGGSVQVCGTPPEQASRQGMVGAMLQETSLPSRVRVRELVWHVSRFYPNPLPVGQCLEEAGVAPLAGKRVERLSGGQQRRVAFALALVGRPRFLFLDEPTEGLDIEARREFWEALGRWTDEYGTTVCFTTHDLSEADQYARRVVVLNRGRLAADGAPETLKSRLGQTRVRFTAEADWSASRLSDHLGVTVTATDTAGRFDAWTADIDRVIRLLAQDLAFSGIETVQQSLDDVFRAVTRSSEAANDRTREGY